MRDTYGCIARPTAGVGLIALKCAQGALFLAPIGLGTALLENGQLWTGGASAGGASAGLRIKYEL